MQVPLTTKVWSIIGRNRMWTWWNNLPQWCEEVESQIYFAAFFELQTYFAAFFESQIYFAAFFELPKKIKLFMGKYNKRTEELDDEEPSILQKSGSPHDYSMTKN